MRFTLEIDCDNAAFGPDSKDAGFMTSDELDRIFAKIVRVVEVGYLDGPCMDSNGNTVGKWELS